MKIPEMPELPSFDFSLLETLNGAAPVELAAGERFIAQIESTVMPTKVYDAADELLGALFEYVPCLLAATEAALALSLEPVAEATKKEIVEAMAMYKKAREVFEKVNEQ